MKLLRFFSGNIRNYEETTEIVTENLLNWLNLKVTGTVLYSQPAAGRLVKCFFSWQLTTAGIRRFLNTLTRFSGYSKHYNKTMAEKQLWHFATWGSICASKAGASSHLQTLKSVDLTSAVIQKASTRGTKHFVLMHCLISCLRTLK